MKKIIIFMLIVFVIIITIIGGFMFWNNKNLSIITLDINPSIKIYLNKEGIVKKVVPLNEDAKDVIDDNLKNKDLDETLRLLTDNLISKGYASGDTPLAIILHAEGNVRNEEIEKKLNEVFEEKHLDPRIVVVGDISKEEEELAKKYNISPAKASYITTITREKEYINVDDLADKSVNELNETKETGRYCEKGYTLEGEWCLKEVGTLPSTQGKVCPRDYIDYEGVCYEMADTIDTGELMCQEGFELEDGECITNNIMEPIVTKYTCSKGMLRTKGETGQASFGSGPANDPVCVDTYVTHPVTICELPENDPTERIYYNGKCYWHAAPVIEEGCPGKVQVEGMCWDEVSNVYLCPNNYNSNPRTKDDNCYTVLNNVYPTPSEYKCEDGWVLKNNKCVFNEKMSAYTKKTCPNGYSLIDNNWCVNYNKTAEKENGLVCDEEDTILKNNICIKYEKVEVRFN